MTMSRLKKAPSCFELSNHMSSTEYNVGDFLVLKMRLEPPHTSQVFYTKAEILECFLPFTMAQVMLIRLHDISHGLKGKYVAKLHDRRHLFPTREHDDNPQWSPALEVQYRRHILQRGYEPDTHPILPRPSPAPSVASVPILTSSSPIPGENSSISSTTSLDVLVRGRDQDDHMDTEHETEELSGKDLKGNSKATFSAEEVPYEEHEKEQRTATTQENVVNEEEYREKCVEMHSAELEVYRRLEDVQGELVPRLIADLEVLEHLPSYKHGPQSAIEAFKVPFATPGLLLQHIANAFTLAQLYTADKPPPPLRMWQDLGDQAISTINLIRWRGIRNPLVCWNGLDEKWKVFMMDFGHCVIRTDETEDDWMWEMYNTDEKGCMGVVLQAWLKRHVRTGYVYQRTPFTRELDKRFG